MQAYDNQKTAIESININTFVSAGAGTGKTYVLVQRFIELLKQEKANVSEIAAITFTEKAAKEMKDRIRSACAEEKYVRELENSRIGTIHGFCARIIKENAIQLGIDPMSNILDETESFTLLDKITHKQILALLEKDDINAITLVSEYGLKETKNIIRALIKHRIDIDTLIKSYPKPVDTLDEKAIALNKNIFPVYEEAKKSYENYKTRKSLLDFDDLIIYTVYLLKNNKSIRRHYQKIIKFIFVDEFQDTDFHQREIIFWLAEDGAISMADEINDVVLCKDKLFIVGDNKQSIYRFRGADVSVFQDTKRILGKNGKMIDLDINMRSTPPIIDFFNNLFGSVMGKDKTGKEDYDTIYTNIIPGRNLSNTTSAVEFLNITVSDDDRAFDIRQKEADLIAKKIIHLNLAQGVNFKDVAVLFRAMTDIKLYEDAFRKYKIPYYVIAGSGFFGRQEILDILNYLKVLDNENDKISMAGILRGPMFGLSDNELYWWSKEKKTHEQVLSLMERKDKISISSLIQEIVRLNNYKAILAAQYMGEQKIANIHKLVETARRFESKGIFTLTDFIQYLNELVVNEAHEGEAAVSEEESNVVKIMTIHKAKGLEFPVVIIPDIHRKPRPIGGSILFDRKFNWLGIKVRDTDGEFQEPPMRKLIKEELEKKETAESKRLLYVAATRTKDRLIFSGKFDDNKSKWSTWLSEHIKVNNVATITEIAITKPAPSSDKKETSLSDISVEDILRQVEPLPKYPESIHTATVRDSLAYTEAIKRGIEIHNFFKNWDFKDGNIPDFAKAFLKDPIYGEITSASEIKRELPITYKYKNGIMEGVIDLLYHDKDGNWCIVDYKTNNIKKQDVPLKAKAYKKQLERYAEGLEKILDERPKKLTLFFTTPGISCEV